MNKIIRSLLAGVTGAFVAVTAALAQLPSGAISVGSVSGDVTFATAGSTTYQRLAAGASLPQGATVKTGNNSTATVVFSSGSTAIIAANSIIEFTKFEQEAFSGPIPTKGEPSVSKTEINVIDGSVAAKVNKLKKGSSYTVNSPVGAAGVRGTTFVVTFSRATGQFTVATVEGLVVMTARATGVSTEVAGTETKAVVAGVEAGSVQIVEAAQLPVAVAQAFVNLVAQIAPELATQTAQTVNKALPAGVAPVVVPAAPATTVPQQTIVVIPDTTVIVSPN